MGELCFHSPIHCYCMVVNYLTVGITLSFTLLTDCSEIHVQRMSWGVAFAAQNKNVR
jgi:hypothetical protein